ncbi:MAG: peptidoglycan-binding protein [Acidobacteriia bacterium]|nr:peptidoglycan-binding protein [Terriglobia bacterium]
MRRGSAVKWLVAVLMAALVLPGAVEGASAQGGKKAPVSRKVSARKSTGKRSKGRAQQVRGQKAPAAERITEIQQALAKSGAYSGKPSGKWDAATVQAMKKFQEEQGLNPTGKMDARSLQKLGLGSEIAGLAAPIPTAGGPAGDAESSRNPY